MIIQAYTAYSGIFTIAVSTVRPQAARSTQFIAATLHEDYAAKAAALLEEHIHIFPTDQAYPMAARLQNYFPTATVGGQTVPIYAMKELMPAGAPRDIDAQFMLEITRLRYQFSIVLLKAAFATTAVGRNAISRAIEFAIKSLFDANSLPSTYIPGDNAIRPENADTTLGPTDIDIVCELGAATQRTGVDIPDPLSP